MLGSSEWNARKTKAVRVLAVDDSAVMRGILRTLFAVHAEKRREPKMELCGTVGDGMECLAAVLRLRPDVVVLDLEIPRMHGLDVLERLRIEEPELPVIMCSAHTDAGARATLEALALGATDYVMKPSAQRDYGAALETLAGELLPKIAVFAGGGRVSAETGPRRQDKARMTEDARALPRGGNGDAQIEIVVIGVSTGGPSALEAMLPKLGRDFPVPVMIVQHMPKLFTGALAERLDRCCALRVREAYEGADVTAGTIWLAPGDAHMEVAPVGAQGGRTAVVALHQQRSPNHCKPSVDYLFSSAARMYGAGTLALVMTGMGADGLTGARLVHNAGGVVMTQDKATSAVWGMPGRVFQAGISRDPLPLGALADELIARVGAGRDAQSGAGDAAVKLAVPRREVARERRLEVLHGML